MDFAKREEQILKTWKSLRAFEKSVSSRPSSKPFVFYEGPPTANGKPGLHHVFGRSFKDVICRYKTMRGFRVERRAGWDTHGLPVEIQVEKQLGFSNKKDIEEYGIAEFNAKCRESVWEYKQEWERLTERMAFWIDTENPYITYDPLYMESLWWILSEAKKRDLLYEGHRIVPFCTRCGTSLSSHEVAQGYADVVDETVTVRFAVVDDAGLGLPKDTSILAWTTTPWTLPANTALAVGADISYVLARVNDEYVIVAQERASVVLGEEAQIERTLKGKELVGIGYRAPFDALADVSDKAFRILAGDFVTTEEGTGVVHIAPMYGEDDNRLAQEANLPIIHAVNEDGTFNERVPVWEGKNAKESDPLIIAELRAQGALFSQKSYKHTYPFCWRCGTALLYYGRHSWFIRMTQIKEELVAANQKVNWTPAYIKNGRFGEWLGELKDWGISRSRYWGTPLPIWRCEEASCGHIEVVGSRDDLAKATKGTNTFVLLRHGYSEKNEKKVLAGSYPEKVEYELTEQGKKEAAVAAREIKKAGGVDVIVASPFTRTKQTAEIVGAELGVEVEFDTGLLETNHGDLEELPATARHERYPDLRELFVNAPEGAETYTAVRKRMLEVLARLEKKYEGKRILIVSHGDPLWLLEAGVMGLTIDEAMGRRASKAYPQPGEHREIHYASFPYNDAGELDLHRPYIDEVTFACPKCSEGSLPSEAPKERRRGTMRRDEYLADVWFDSGSMPYASVHYPFSAQGGPAMGGEHKKPENFPADYIAEGIDQTRGWFYTLLAVAGILGFTKETPPYKNVVSLGLVLDEKGLKMSKSKGNIVDPIALADRYGMDAVRWYFFTVNGPGEVKRFAERDVAQRQQKFIATLYNSLTFLRTYAPQVHAPQSTPKSSGMLDVWIVARLKEVAVLVAEGLDAYEVTTAARLLDEFVMNDLSNWYVRRARPRLQQPSSPQELEEAAEVLAFVLSETAKLAAPFVPFVAESVWQDVNDTQKESVHWQEWNVASKLSSNEQSALVEMKEVREWAQVILRLRAEAGLKVRQPLAAFVLPKKISSELAHLLAEEVNIKERVAEAGASYRRDEATGVAIDTELTPQLQREGQVREIVRRVQGMRKDIGLAPTDKIRLVYSLPPELRDDFASYEERLGEECRASEVRQEAITSGEYDAHASVPLDPIHSIEIAITKAK